MASYANGQFPKSATTALVTAPGQRLTSAAARQWDALARSVLNTYGWMPALTDSYRPYSVQEAIFRQRYRAGAYSPFGDYRSWLGQRWGRVTGAAAAVPGTSNHGWGIAVDVTGLGGFSGLRYRQLASLAARFGFSNAEGRSVNEAWHWTFTGSYTVTNPIGGGGGSVTVPTIPGAPAPITPEDDMTPEQDARLQRIEAALSVPGQPYTWLPALDNKLNMMVDEIRNIAADVRLVRGAQQVPGQPFDWAPATHNSVARVIGELAALRGVLDVLAAREETGGADGETLAEAAETGARRALEDLTLIPKKDG